jgi:hypothetical protein
VSRYKAYVPNCLLSDDGQAYQQAKRQWVEAYLRKDSGAAMDKDEYDNADKSYFVQPGDSAATVRRKQRARQTITDSIRTQGTGGNASGPFTPGPLDRFAIRTRAPRPISSCASARRAARTL